MQTHNYTERINFVNDSGQITAKTVPHTIKVDQTVPKLGLMLVGWGGNNGVTLTAGLLANKQNLTWKTRTGEKSANFYGSLTQSVTTKIGVKYNKENNRVQDVFKVVKDLVPLVSPEDIEVTGWDISGLNLYEAAYRSQVLEPTLIEQLKEELENSKPMSAVFNPDYIASNQADRADNVFTGSNLECVNKLREDIKNFSQTVDKVLVLWTANTEKFFEKTIQTEKELEDLIHSEEALPGSVLYAYACAKEGAIFINGSPQNTVSPGMIALYKSQNSFIGGSDFKTGQTKFKSLMLDFFMGSGLRLASCMSYNHLGNNDGKNLNEPATFRSKEISKAGVLSDEIEANPVLYPEGNKQVDHTVVIKYCPFVGDSKRAMDEYSAEIFLQGGFTLVTHATCEDSLLAAPIMLDLILLGEFFTRVQIDEKPIGPVLSYLSFFFKAPVTNHPEYVFNSFSRQKDTLINFLKACGGVPAGDSTLLSIGF
jgi:myo-inositol-1-phosphate synthase